MAELTHRTLFMFPPVRSLVCVRHVAVAISGALLGGIAGAVVALIVALIIGFVVARQVTAKKQRKLLSEYSEQLHMVRRSASGARPVACFVY